VDLAVAPLGLTHAQYTFLASLRGVAQSGSDPSQRELADHTGLDPIYISKLAKSLENAGLIKRIADRRDTRAVHLTITKEGTLIIDRAVTIVRNVMEQLTAPLGGTSSRGVQTLINDLEKLIAFPSPAGMKNALKARRHT
jgi:DNA-binding MarR family transcriptional regulator